MTYFDFLLRIRDKLSDTREPYLWSDAELLSYVNDTLSHIFYFCELDKASISFNTVADESSYSLPSDLVKVISVFCEKVRLIEVDFDEFNYLGDGKGLPKFYFIDGAILHLKPIPDKVYVIRLYYQRRFRQPSSVVEELPIPGYMYQLLEYGVLAKAYSKQDSEVYDLNLADYYGKMYNGELLIVRSRSVRDRGLSRVSPVMGGLL